MTKSTSGRFYITTAILTASVLLWIWGLFYSPIFLPESQQQEQSGNRFIQNHSPELETIKTLADAYWQRYADIKNDKHYGRNGKMGIFGAEEHFRQHGKQEGRVYGPIPVPEDPLLESELAEIYWQRYPDIERSAIWGRESELGTLGPRDHYHYLGQKLGKIWGPAPSKIPIITD